MPAEPQLLKFKMQLGAQIREAEIRRYVDEVVQRCRPLIETSPREALQTVSEELANHPSDKRLLSLQSNIEKQLSHWTHEKARVSYLARARRWIKENLARPFACCNAARPKASSRMSSGTSWK